MTTTALVPYNPEPDAGVGLSFRRYWLVSCPQGTGLRWLAPWIQSLISEAWNLPLTALRVPFVRSCLGFTAAAAMVAWLVQNNAGVLFVVWFAGMLPLVGRLLEEPNDWRLTEAREVMG